MRLCAGHNLPTFDCTSSSHATPHITTTCPLQLLPKKMFACDKIPDVKGPADKAQPMKGVHASASLRGDTCDKKPEASCIAPDCVWCTSAAVGRAACVYMRVCAGLALGVG